MKYDRALTITIYMQAKDGFPWATEQSHLLMMFLMAKGKAAPQGQAQNRPPGGQGGRKFNKTFTPEGKEVCLNFNGVRGCRFGQGCKYVHVCNISGCAKPHPRHQHGTQ